ncbi:MAG: V-type ATPase subunit [Sphaerochaetaceae bacterium]|jgi:V/A-type H+-transporting ATPase subunit C
MDAVSRYGFINAKLRARIGLMRQSHLTDDMLKATSLVDAVALLRETGYAAVAKAYDETGDLQAMEFVLLEGEIAGYQEVERYLDNKPAAFVKELLGKIEEDNLKNAIRLWYSSVVRLHSIRYRSEYLYKDKIVNDVNWAGIVNATDWKGVVESVKGTQYYGALSGFTQEMIQKNGLFDLETVIDRDWYDALMQSVTLLSAVDQQVALKVFYADFDLKNLLNLIRFGWYHQLEKERLHTTLFPWGSLYGSKEVAAYIAAPVDSRDPMPIVKRFYLNLVPEIQDIIGKNKDGAHSEQLMAQETLRLEQYLQTERGDEYHRILSQDPFSIGIALSYFFLYRSMNSLIRAILNGKYYGYSDQQIRGEVG